MDQQQYLAIKQALKAHTALHDTPEKCQAYMMAAGFVTLEGDTHENYGGPKRPDRVLAWTHASAKRGEPSFETFTATHDGHTLLVRWDGPYFQTKWKAYLDGVEVFLFDGREVVEMYAEARFSDHIDAMLALERCLGLSRA